MRYHHRKGFRYNVPLQPLPLSFLKESGLYTRLILSGYSEAVAIAETRERASLGESIQ